MHRILQMEAKQGQLRPQLWSMIEGYGVHLEFLCVIQFLHVQDAAHPEGAVLGVRVKPRIEIPVGLKVTEGILMPFDSD